MGPVGERKILVISNSFHVIFRCVLASLYEVVSVGRSDGRLDGWLDGNPFFLNAENEQFSS